MEQLIRFRLLTSTLSVDEYRSLLCNVLDDTNMNEFSSMIFHHFHVKLTKQNAEQTQTSNELQMSSINQEISRIISQRKSQTVSRNVQDDDTNSESEPQTQLPLNMTDCADAIIREIASYLPFKSYSNFQCGCRSIFYAANNPSALYELDGSIDLSKCFDTENMHQIRLFMKRFEGIQKLKVGGRNEKYIPLIQFRNLKRLSIFYPEQEEVERYLSSNMFNWNNITHLNVMGNCTIEIIKRCKHLHTLNIADFYDDDDDDDEGTVTRQLAELECMPNLYRLEMDGGMNINTRIVLKDMCNTLQSLSIWSEDHNLEGLTFRSLVELELKYPSPEDIISMITKTKQLKRLKVYTSSDDSYDLACEKIFALDTLEYCYFGLVSGSDISQMSRWIESSFRKKRHILKLEIYCGKCNIPADQIYEAIVGLWNALNAWHTRHFMLVFRFRTNQEHARELTALNQWLDSVSNASSIFVNKISTTGEEKIIISNKWSVFIGY
eukprot:147683_1